MEAQMLNHVAVRELVGGAAALLLPAGPMNTAAALEAAGVVEKLGGDHKAVVLAGAGDSLCGPVDREEIRRAAKDSAALERISGAYQALTQAVRFSAVPVVALGTGKVTDFALELASSSALTLLAPDAQVGYETPGNGFPPMGGGLARAALDAYAAVAGVPGADVVPFLKRAFQMLYSGKPASGGEAGVKGYLPKWTPVAEGARCTPELAAELALCAARIGYHPPEASTVTVKGFTARGALDITVINANLGGFLSDGLLNLARLVSWVLSGGDVPDRTEISEARFLALERAAFVRAIKEG